MVFYKGEDFAAEYDGSAFVTLHGSWEIPDLRTTVLRLTITGMGADSSLANGNNPRLARRVASVAAMFLGAALGAVVIHYSISAALWHATAMSAVCGFVVFRSGPAPDQR